MKYLIGIVLIMTLRLLSAQESYESKVIDWRNELNQEFKSKEDSPLDKKDFRRFKELDFFPINDKYVIKASLELTPEAQPFKMPTSTSRTPIYVRYAIARFSLDGQELVLSLYRNDPPPKDEEYKNYLFVPFTDNTNGETSYGGGRYLDVRIPEGDTLEIDFNKAYNPYCAYSDRYSCPIPPRENNLNIAIEAGVKVFKKH